MNNKATLKEKFKNELAWFLCYTLFFTVLFYAFSIYRRLILDDYGITYTHYGFYVVEALILAKLVMLGEIFGLGTRFHNKPLIYSTLYKTVIFGLFVLAFKVIEHFGIGLLKGKTFPILFQEILETGIYQLLAALFIMLFIFVFFFAFLETGRVMGDNKLFNLFFKRSRYDG